MKTVSLQRYVDWLVQDAVPVWLERGHDVASGFFYDKFHLDGRADPTALLRTRAQFRQVYTLAHAASLGVTDVDRALSVATTAAAALHRAAWGQGGRPGWIKTFTMAGEAVDATRDLYDHAFVLLGLAWLAKATGDGLYRTWIDDTLAAIDTVLAAPAAGWAEDDAGGGPRRQNPHMHQLEASLALYETTGEARFLERATAMVTLFERSLFDPATGSLREYFGPEWQAGPQWHSDERLEPGHHVEWVWLLRRYARAVPEARVDGWCAALLARAKALGAIAPHGFLALESDPQGAPLQDRQRLWTQTEYIKALLVQGELAAAETLAGHFLDVYLKPAPRGCWIDLFTVAGEPVAADIPASSLYHLFAALPEIRLALGQA